MLAATRNLNSTNGLSRWLRAQLRGESLCYQGVAASALAGKVACVDLAQP